MVSGSAEEDESARSSGTSALLTTDHHLLRLWRRHSLATIVNSHGLRSESRRNRPKCRHALSTASCTASSASDCDRSMPTARRYAAGRSGSTKSMKACWSPPIASWTSVGAKLIPLLLFLSPAKSPGRYSGIIHAAPLNGANREPSRRHSYHHVALLVSLVHRPMGVQTTARITPSLPSRIAEAGRGVRRLRAPICRTILSAS